MESVIGIWPALTQEDATYPDLFHPNTTDVPTMLTASEKLAVISSCATSFPSTASRLSAIKDLPIPSAQSSSQLIELGPRLAQAQKAQDLQATEIAELRTSTATAIQRWYELGVLGGSECWTEREGRLANMEKRVRRAEIHKIEEQKERNTYKS